MKRTKEVKKVVSMLLILSMIIHAFFLPQPTVKANVGENVTVATGKKAQTEKIVKKTENATVYEDGSGKMWAEIYARDIRFEDEDGILTDYDVSLKKLTEKESKTGEDLSSYEYQTTRTDKMTYFPEKVTNDTPIVAEYESYAVKINPTTIVQGGTLETEEKDAVRIAYEADDIDYQYESTTEGLKESIVLEKKTDQDRFEFDITLKNCSFG